MINYHFFSPRHTGDGIALLHSFTRRTAISHHKKQPTATELLKAPVSEKLFVFTDQPYFFFYKTKLNEKEKGDGHNHMKSNGDVFEKPQHEPQQDSSIAYPPASPGSAHPIKCAM